MRKYHKICEVCGAGMRRHGVTKAGRERYFCPHCRKATTIGRDDTRMRHRYERLVAWLTSPDSKTEIAKRYGVTRQALSYEFRQFFRKNPDGMAPLGYEAKMLIVDAKFIHGSILCALIAVDEHDKIFWQFADGENYTTWHDFFIRFKAPQVVIADGEKGVAGYVKRYWPDTKFQRCHFHIVKLVIQYLSRNPREEAGVSILKLMYQLKYVKDHEDKKRWLMFFKIWEKRFEKVFNEKNESGVYVHKKIRSVRSIVKRAIPDLFTYLDFPGCPNTTNLVEGWVNAALAEALRRHRGLHLSQKKILVSIILSHLTREKPTRKLHPKNTPIFP
jgi:mutator family transposase